MPGKKKMARKGATVYSMWTVFFVVGALVTKIGGQDSGSPGNLATKLSTTDGEKPTPTKPSLISVTIEVDSPKGKVVDVGYTDVDDAKSNSSATPQATKKLDAHEPAVFAAIPIIVILIIICGCIAFFLFLWQNKRKQIDCWEDHLLHEGKGVVISREEVEGSKELSLYNFKAHASQVYQALKFIVPDLKDTRYTTFSTLTASKALNAELIQYLRVHFHQVDVGKISVRAVQGENEAAAWLVETFGLEIPSLRGEQAQSCFPHKGEPGEAGDIPSLPLSEQVNLYQLLCLLQCLRINQDRQFFEVLVQGSAPGTQLVSQSKSNLNDVVVLTPFQTGFKPMVQYGAKQAFIEALRQNISKALEDHPDETHFEVRLRWDGLPDSKLCQLLSLTLTLYQGSRQCAHTVLGMVKGVNPSRCRDGPEGLRDITSKMTELSESGQLTVDGKNVMLNFTKAGIFLHLPPTLHVESPSEDIPLMPIEEKV